MAFMETTISSFPYLPPEILDHVVDYLYDDTITLKWCCLVSKSWVPRTRNYLFSRIKFDPQVRFSIQLWKGLFPDPSFSPAHHTRVLLISGLPTIKTANAIGRTWVHSFNQIVELRLSNFVLDRGQTSLAQLHGLSPRLRSLLLHDAYAPLPEIFNLICSFPLLEDLSLRYKGPESNIDGWDTPPTSPKLTGSLELHNGIVSIARGLLRLPDGLHFSKITASSPVDHAKAIVEVVSRCSGTLESLCVDYLPSNCEEPTSPPPLNLSKCLNLKDVKFMVGSIGITWVITTLQTVRLDSLRQVAIYSYGLSSYPTEEEVQEWHDLDRLLAGLENVHSVVLRIASSDKLGKFAPRLLPGITSSGVVYEVWDK